MGVEVDADVALDAFTALIRGRAKDLTTERTAEGLRKAAATGLLFRGLELLDATRVSPVAAGELLMRSAVEVALRGRFLLACDDGADEFARMIGDDEKRGVQMLTQLKVEDPKELKDTELRTVPEWVLKLVPPSSSSPRDTYSLAAAIDKVTKLKPKDCRSAVYAYRRYYQWLSNSAMHGGLSAIGRFLEATGSGVVDPLPDPLSPGRSWDVLMATQLLELAQAVWTAHGLRTDELEATGVCWPDVEEDEDEDDGEDPGDGPRPGWRAEP